MIVEGVSIASESPGPRFEGGQKAHTKDEHPAGTNESSKVVQHTCIVFLFPRVRVCICMCMVWLCCLSSVMCVGVYVQ